MSISTLHWSPFSCSINGFVREGSQFNCLCNFFIRFDLERCENCKCDHFQSGATYNNLDVQSKSCGGYSFNYLYEYLWFVDWSGGISSSVSGSTAYIRFVSDDTEHYSGFNLTFIGGSSAGE